MPPPTLPLLMNDAIPEREFLRVVVDAARLWGWRVHHTRPALARGGRWLTPIQGDAGLPDLILLRPPRCIVAELKVGRNKLTPEQQAWLDAFAQIPSIEAYVWRPSDWERIVDLLRP